MTPPTVGVASVVMMISASSQPETRLTHVALGLVQVVLTVETRGREHIDEITAALQAEGLPVDVI